MPESVSHVNTTIPDTAAVARMTVCMSHEHPHPPEERQANVLRIRKIVCQLNGVEKILDQDRDCSEILAQLISARRAINSLSEKLIHGHLHQCIEESRDRKNGAKKLKELVTVLERYVE